MLATLRLRNFALLWTAGLISLAGSLVLFAALPLHVYRLTGSTLATAATLAASTLPRVIGGSFAGVFVDRWDRRVTMVISDLLRAVLLLPLLLGPDRLEVIYAVALVQGIIGLFFNPAESALLPLLVGEERLVSANALNSLNDNLGMLTGPALGTLLYAQAGIGAVVVVDAASFALSAALIWAINSRGRADPHAPELAADGAALSPVRQVLHEWREGLGIIRERQTLRVLFGTSCLEGTAEGVYLTLSLAPLVLDVLGGTEAQVGWLTTVQAIGGLIAGVVLARIGMRASMRRLLGLGMLGTGLADLGTANARLFAPAGAPALGVALGFAGLAGFPVVAEGTGRQSLVQTQTTDRYRGRVFGTLAAVQGAALLVGYAIGGVLGGVAGLVVTLSAGALLRVLAGVLALLLLPRDDATSAPVTVA
ncbi:MAG: MFS transporter [Thermomicrobiales bacterium]